MQSKLRGQYGLAKSISRGGIMSDNGDGGHTVGECGVCGKKNTRLYQNNTCRSCLLSSFGKLQDMINLYRDGYGNGVYKNTRSDSASAKTNSV